MTWGELIEQCTELSFTGNKDYVKNKSAYEHAANWAINYIASKNIRPWLKKKVITLRSLPNILQGVHEEIIQYEGRELVFKAKQAKAYYFEVDGAAEVIIHDDSGENLIKPLALEGFTAFRGFCMGNLTITFKGEYAYSIRNLAAYNILQSGAVEDIPPYSQYISYDFKKIDPSFLGFALDKPVFEGEGLNGYRQVGDYKREGSSIIKFQRGECGQFSIWYKAYPKRINADTALDFIIELDDMLCDVLPYLMASRLLLDDDAQKAVIYNNQANNLLHEIYEGELTESLSPAVIDGSDWGGF